MRRGARFPRARVAGLRDQARILDEQRTPECRNSWVYNETCDSALQDGSCCRSPRLNVGAPHVGDTTGACVDGALRAIAKRRAGLDADEAPLAARAEAMQIWRPLGMVNALDYHASGAGVRRASGRSGCGSRARWASCRLMERALAAGELSYSAVRELSAGRDAGDGSRVGPRRRRHVNLRQIEELVAGHAPGALPDEPADPTVRPHVVRFELSPETYARLRQAARGARRRARHGAVR